MKPQNILFLLSDQHSPKALGCYGSSVVRTPNLDRLAARGTRFSSAYCNSPICISARAALATGRYVHEIGYWDNGRAYEGSVPSWGHRLAFHGHDVESIGKLHFRSEEDPTGFVKQHLPMHVVGGGGDIFGILRDGSVHLAKYRGYHDDAGPGESTYTKYDREITAASVEWLKAKANEPSDKPWLAFVSLVCPHPPLQCPEEFYNLYPPEEMPWPVLHDPGERPEHPAMVDHRIFQNCEEPFSEDAVRRSLSAYFGLCSFMDDNMGKVLGALEETGLAETTRVIYTADHGESNGNQGLWGKYNMYEDSVGVPLIMAGDGVPAGHVVDTPVTHVDIYQTVLEGMGAPGFDEDCALPGTSLFKVANGADADRVAFAEYHAAASNTGSFMIRKGAYKFVYYVGYPNQLFNLDDDPDETRDLADDPTHADIRRDLEGVLRGMIDPEAVDALAKADQAARIVANGGREAIRSKGAFGYTPAPGEEVVYK